MSQFKLIRGDCLELMKDIPSASIDFIFTDLPYGGTHNSWDKQLDLDNLWQEYKRIIKNHGCIALWAQPPFSFNIASKAMDIYRYEWIIEKTKATGHLNSKRMPLKAHESIQIFYKHLPTYNPQKTEGHAPVHSFTKHQGDGSNYGKVKHGISGGGNTDRYPRDVLSFKWDTQTSCLHPTQKPIEACKYMIKTYTNEGDTVLDNCMGSGSTGVAAIMENRGFIGMELCPVYFKVASKRITEAKDGLIQG